MSEKIKTALPPDLDLGGGWVVEWDAVDPVTGDTVAGVIVSATSLLVAGEYGGIPVTGGGGIFAASPYLLVPGPGDSSGLQFGGQVGGTVPPPTTGGTPTPPPTGAPPPLEVTPTLGSVWAWDATKATVKPNSPALVAAFLQYGGSFAYFTIEVGTGIVTSHDPSQTYPVNTAGKPGALDPTVWVPHGQKIGLSNDGHLLIVDHVTQRWHDFQNGRLDSAGELVGWTGAYSMPIGTVNLAHVPNKIPAEGATAAGLPLARGLVTPAQMATPPIGHTLTFTAANLGPSPNPYPAAPWTAGYKTGNWGAWKGQSITGHLPLGSWLRIDPAATISSAAPQYEKDLMATLQTEGIVGRDRGSTFAIHGQDLGGGGSSVHTWQNAGVPLSSGGVVRLSHIPWNRLQVLEPPSA